MTCITCDWYKTVEELFATNFKTLNLDLECSKRLPTLNKALAHLWAYSFLLPWFKISETVDVSSNTYNTCERIYMPVWFYGKWCNSSCFIQDDQCDSCCQAWFGQIDMTYKEAVPQIWNSQYTIKCPLSKTVEYILPNGTQSAYFTYFRYFDTLVDGNSLVTIPEYLLPALDMLVSYHSSALEPADKASVWEDFISYMKQLYEVFKLAKQVPSRINISLFK